MPVQCPECARFLSNAFVVGLQKGPAPCPKCGTALSPGSSPDGPPQAAAAAEVASPASAPVDDATSVRPPDLPADQARPPARDPLAGWDQPDNVVHLSSARADGHQAPPPGVVMGAGAALGGLLGAVVSERSVRGALLGGSLGALAGAAASQVMARRHEVDLVE